MRNKKYLELYLWATDKTRVTCVYLVRRVNRKRQLASSARFNGSIANFAANLVVFVRASVKIAAATRTHVIETSSTRFI